MFTNEIKFSLFEQVNILLNNPIQGGGEETLSTLSRIEQIFSDLSSHELQIKLRARAKSIRDDFGGDSSEEAQAARAVDCKQPRSNGFYDDNQPRDSFSLKTSFLRVN